jgi:hypothetical protein
MIGPEYFTIQAATLLKLAKITSSPRAAVMIAAKAAELQAKSANSPPHISTQTPEVDPPK